LQKYRFSAKNIGISSNLATKLLSKGIPFKLGNAYSPNAARERQPHLVVQTKARYAH